MKILFKNWVLGLTSLLIIIGCNSNSETSQKKFIDITAMDTNFRPQDNFFMYANGNWIKNTQIPPSEASWGSFNILREKSTNDLHFILDSLSKASGNYKKGTNEQLIADLYMSGMDSAIIEKNGIAPLIDDLKFIESIQSAGDILKEVARENTSGAVSLVYDLFPSNIIAFYVYQDDKNSESIVAHFDQGILSLPTKEYYFPQDTSMQKIKTEFELYVKKIFIALGNDELTAKEKARAVVELETMLAKSSKSPVELRDPVANYHKYSVKDLDKKMNGIKWIELIRNSGIQTDSVLVGQPAYYEALDKLLYSEPLDTWKEYLKFRLADNFAGVLSLSFNDPAFDFYGKILRGQKERRARWKKMSEMVDNELGDALGQIYVNKFFPPAAKERMLALVNNLQDAYKVRIQNAEWMNDSTKQKAIEKLSAIVKKIGYPDKWKSYDGVEITKGDIISNLKSTRSFKYNLMIAKLGKPVDKTEWFMTPSTINAYYNSNVNEIVFPAGILQPPFFSMEADDAINYGAIGTVIAHEITHGFDDQGRKFDSKGNLNDWWTKEDAESYNKQAKQIISQFNKFVVLDSLPINGELTQGENIADLGGLIISFNAFKMTRQGQTTEKIDGFTPDQRFFLSYAYEFQTKMTDEITRQQVMSDPHSPDMLRVNGPLSNMPEFYEAFNVQPGDKLYCPDSLRVKVW